MLNTQLILLLCLFERPSLFFKCENEILTFINPCHFISDVKHLLRLHLQSQGQGWKRGKEWLCSRAAVTVELFIYIRDSKHDVSMTKKKKKAMLDLCFLKSTHTEECQLLPWHSTSPDFTRKSPTMTSAASPLASTASWLSRGSLVCWTWAQISQPGFSLFL